MVLRIGLQSPLNNKSEEPIYHSGIRLDVHVWRELSSWRESIQNLRQIPDSAVVQLGEFVQGHRLWIPPDEEPYPLLFAEADYSNSHDKYAAVAAQLIRKFIVGEWKASLPQRGIWNLLRLCEKLNSNQWLGGPLWDLYESGKAQGEFLTTRLSDELLTSMISNQPSDRDVEAFWFQQILEGSDRTPIKGCLGLSRRPSLNGLDREGLLNAAAKDVRKVFVNLEAGKNINRSRLLLSAFLKTYQALDKKEIAIRAKLHGELLDVDDFIKTLPDRVAISTKTTIGSSRVLLWRNWANEWQKQYEKAIEISRPRTLVESENFYQMVIARKFIALRNAKKLVKEDVPFLYKMYCSHFHRFSAEGEENIVMAFFFPVGEDEFAKCLRLVA